MYLSRIKLNSGPEIFDHLNNNKSNLYSDHQFVWSLFPGDKKDGREFLFRKDYKNNETVYFVLSKEKPEKYNSFADIVTKTYEPVIKKDQLFSFSIRANPVIAKKSENGKNSKKHDVWSNARIEGKKKGLDGEELRTFSEAKAMEWLIKKAVTCGFEIDDNQVIIESYHQYRFYNNKSKGGVINIGALDYNGILQVNDVEKMNETLFNGIGKSKSFGCGLLLIKRI
jgi:CRISPR system Cascade subunit CasE